MFLDLCAVVCRCYTMEKGIKTSTIFMMSEIMVHAVVMGALEAKNTVNIMATQCHIFTHNFGI